MLEHTGTFWNFLQLSVVATSGIFRNFPWWQKTFHGGKRKIYIPSQRGVIPLLITSATKSTHTHKSLRMTSNPSNFSKETIRKMSSYQNSVRASWNLSSSDDLLPPTLKTPAGYSKPFLAELVQLAKACQDRAQVIKDLEELVDEGCYAGTKHLATLIKKYEAVKGESTSQSCTRVLLH
jgi:hypothetical protein